MEIVIWLGVIILVFFAPLIVSIIALIKISHLRDELNQLRQQQQPTAKANSQPAAAPQPATEAAPKSVVTPLPPKKPPQPSAPPPLPKTSPAQPSTTTEALLGGRIASFVGIGLLLTGIAFLIGYAIRHAWLGPAARIGLGIGAGFILIALGHWAETRGRERLTVLARVLTGGGAATLYFNVFAAYGMYDLIGPIPTAIGLLLSATLTIVLALKYQSQIVAVIGVVGAFSMPALIQDDDSRIAFLLTYIAMVNLPVILLGLRRNWQGLYNTSFIFTALYQGLLLVEFDPEHGRWLVFFSPLFFLQFTTLGLLKLRSEQVQSDRSADWLRLLLNSLLLLGVMTITIDQLDANRWMGAALVGLGLLHLLVARIGWHWFRSFTNDLVTLLAGALMCFSLALPAQLDGAWVSVGWSLMGVTVCWLSLRARVPLLPSAALILGLLGLLKGLSFDWHLYDVPPPLFLNARFASGLLSAILLGCQGWLHQRMSPLSTEEGEQSLGNAGSIALQLPAVAALAIWVIFMADIYWTLGWDDPWAWLVAAAIWMGIGLACCWTSEAIRGANPVGRFLLALLPLKVLLALFLLEVEARLSIASPAFANHLFAAWAVFVAATGVVASHPRAQLGSVPGFGFSLARWLQIGTALSGILLVTLELHRWNHDWSQVLITLWWALSASGLIGWGFWRRQSIYRYVGLMGFAVTTGKVILVDLMELDGLVRIAAFLGVGILLLLLSFIYQHMASQLLPDDADDE